MVHEDWLNGIRSVAKACWKTSEDKGWHTETKIFDKVLNIVMQAPASPDKDTIQGLLYMLGGPRTKGVPIMSKLMLIVTEVAEAAEVFRNAGLFPKLDQSYQAGDSKGTYYLDYNDAIDPPAKPEGFASELADIIIRVFDLAEDLGIDIASEIARKMRFNASRSYRHGGKVA